MPRVSATAASPSLLFSQEDAALGSALGRCRHGSRIGRANLVEVMEMRVENGAAKEWAENFRQQQIRHRAQLIAGCRMPSHIHTQSAELLDEPPHLGTGG